MGWENWANLSSEILVLVIKKVQERAAEDNEEMRRVVAMAGVCRSWRLAIQSVLAAKPFSVTGLLQFPSSLREAGPLDKPMQCVLKRRGGQFLLYQSDCGSGQELRESKCNFLMGACKRWRPGRIMFMISMDRSARSFSSKSVGCIGKLRSNFWGTAFVLWDFQSGSSFGNTKNYNYNNNSRSNGVTRARPVTFVRFSEEMVNGVRKRKMTCVVRTPRECRGTSSTLSCCPALTSQPHHHHHHHHGWSPLPRSKSLWKWSCMSTLNKSIRSVTGCRPPRGYLSLGEEISKARMEERVSESPTFTGRGLQGNGNKMNLRGVPGMLKKGPKVATFTGAIPEWDVKRQCWSLDFKGRATLPSMHNFQLLMPAAPSTSTSISTSALREDETTTLCRPLFSQGRSDDRRQQVSSKQSVVMQLGKIGKGLYALEFRSPLSAFQAFNIALSSFATTVGAEP